MKQAKKQKPTTNAAANATTIPIKVNPTIIKISLQIFSCLK